MAHSIFTAKNIKSAMVWACIYTVMTFVWALIGKLIGFHDVYIQYSLYFNTAILLPSFFIYLFAMSRMKGNVDSGTYWVQVSNGLLLTFFVSILGPLNPIVSMLLISPDYFEHLTSYVIQSGMMSPEQAKQQINLSAFITQSMIGSPIFGFALSVIAALFLRSKHSQMVNMPIHGSTAK